MVIHHSYLTWLFTVVNTLHTHPRIHRKEKSPLQAFKSLT